MKSFKDKLIQFLPQNNAVNFYNLFFGSFSKIKSSLTYNKVFGLGGLQFNFQAPGTFILGKLFFIIGMSLSFSGCQTTKVTQAVDAPSKPSYWVFKTNVYSSKRNKNISGYTHISYMSPKLFRMDIYDPLGLINAGTLVYNNGNFEAVMPLEKKYFFGVANAESMGQILKSPIDPALFTNIIFQKKPTDKGWECNEDLKGFLRDCRNRNAGIDIVWKKNISNMDGWVQIAHNEGEVDFKLKSSRTIQPLADEKFRLHTPNSYTKFKVDQDGIRKL